MPGIPRDVQRKDASDSVLPQLHPELRLPNWKGKDRRFVGPRPGEVAYMPLNQTLAYISIEQAA